jgi:hypothetical protein
VGFGVAIRSQLGKGQDMSRFRVGSLGHSLTFRGWHIVWQGFDVPAGVSSWEAWDPFTGEILGAASYRELVSMIRAGDPYAVSV